MIEPSSKNDIECKKEQCIKEKEMAETINIIDPVEIIAQIFSFFW